MSLARLLLRRWNPLWRIYERLMLSRAKHPTLAGHPRIALRLSRLLPEYRFDRDHGLLDADGAPPDVVLRRREGLARLASRLHRQLHRTVEATAALHTTLSDLRLMDRYRVPFPFRDAIAAELPSALMAASTDGLLLRDLDGNESFDLGGSYGVNLFGSEFYKACIARATERAQELGVVLGPLHPVVAENVARLRELSELDEVSFHMSGTEAVMQAVRLARYHTGRSHVVRFCGAYHGWWDGVQPGPGNPRPARETYTFSELSETTLDVLAMRDDIACVLVNPLQALTPNRPPASDSTLVSGRATPVYDKGAYTAWLRQLREVCDERGIVLIFDEVFLGFRLARGGAQEYFGVRADLVTYGKTLGGGLPVGVLCGRRALMQRWREDRPADLCFARGTFAAHPYVMTAMNEFLRHLETPTAQRSWLGLDERWAARAARLNAAMAAAALPVRAGQMASIFSLGFERPGRYLWMLQFYLRAHGLVLGPTGTARLIFSHDYDDESFDEVVARLVAATREAVDDGFFWCPAEDAERTLKRQLRGELLGAFLGRRTPTRATSKLPQLDLQTAREEATR